MGLPMSVRRLMWVVGLPGFLSACVWPEPISESQGTFLGFCSCQTNCFGVNGTSLSVCGSPAILGPPQLLVDCAPDEQTATQNMSTWCGSLASVFNVAECVLTNDAGAPLPNGNPVPPVQIASPPSCIPHDPPSSPPDIVGETALGSYVVTFTQDQSTLSVVSGGSTGNTHVSGEFAYDVDSAGNVTVTLFFASGGQFGFGFLNSISNLRVIDEGTAVGVLTGTTATFDLGAFAEAISFDALFGGHQAGVVTSTTQLTATMDPVGNSFQMTAHFTSPDGSSSAFMSLVGTYSAVPPIAVAGGPYQGNCTQPRAGAVHVDGSASTNGDGNAAHLVDYIWFADNHIVAEGPTADADLVLSAGTHDLVLRVINNLGEFSDSVTTATIAVGPPSIQSVANAVPCLWPPNHEYVLYDIGQQVQVQVTDACDPSPSVQIIGGSSSEANNATGSGNTTNDLVLSPEAFCARSERSGPGNGRVYTIQVQATNFAGLQSAVATVTVTVPHDQGHGQACPALPGSAFIPDGDPRCNLPGNIASTPTPPTLTESPAMIGHAAGEPVARNGCIHGAGNASFLLVLVALQRVFARRRPLR